MQRKRALHFFLLCVGGILLAACGAQQANASNTGSSLTPTATSMATSTVASTANGKVAVIVGKAQYTPDATITVTINNGLAKSIVAANHQSGCTLVTLQWQDAQGNWQDLNRCRLGMMTKMIMLPPHSAQVQTIAPTSGTFARKAQWVKGNYRIVFNYTFGNADVESIPTSGAPGSPIYSSTFSVA
jgi:outer membrane biogenesis lipoprotein LolB